MANNQVFLKCPCGERIKLGKYYPTDWDFCSSTQIEINEFLSAHSHAHEEDMFYGLSGGRFPFSFVTDVMDCETKSDNSDSACLASPNTDTPAPQAEYELCELCGTKHAPYFDSGRLLTWGDHLS